MKQGPRQLACPVGHRPAVYGCRGRKVRSQKLMFTSKHLVNYVLFIDLQRGPCATPMLQDDHSDLASLVHAFLRR